ncbi:TPA: DUF5361 domain-containing protein [Streptococcus suis]|uniref:DUF5361 domain-containing protein n=1 Tax=Streptococcus suis TaxID=1307 RepID=UPI000CF50FB6|nr:DUF5361 domain-containing protein [Streptococcus suis]HEL2334033.1 DUF5361 domain-containing protein [Streptococcus suis]HEM5158969.1 DUF5361 domain-containing protein [Streptococcus suis]HEM5362809.1 DUF5361 domain-containing protein [Streptococcus suis]
MIAADEDALVCDLAETYGIYDYRQLPIARVAVFACGLSESSRIKKVVSGQKEDLDTLLLAGIYDTVRLLFWAKTKDGQAGRNRPNSVAQALEGSKVEREERVFSSGEEFEHAMRALEIEIGGEERGD